MNLLRELKSQSNWIKTFLIINLSGLALGVCLTALSMSEKSTTKAKTETVTHKYNKTAELDPIVTNLSGIPQKYVRVEIVLEGNELGVNKAISSRSVIRDTVIRTIGSKHFYEIESLQDKLLLKEELLNNINENMVENEFITNLYFIDFAVQ